MATSALSAWQQGNLPAEALPPQPAAAPQGNLGASAPAAAPSDWSGYLAANPDVKAAYDGLKGKNKKKYGSPEEYAEYHYRAYGSGENRQGVPTLDNTYTFRTNKANEAGTITADPNATYRLVNKKGKNSTLAEGQGQQGLDAIYRQATQLSQSKGKKADWSVEVLDPATGKWGVAARDKAGQSTLGKIADIGLPVIGGIVAGPLGAAAGSGLSSAAQGRSLKSSLKRAAIAGVASYAGGQVFGANPLIHGAPLTGGAAASGGLIGGLGGGLGNAAASATGDIIVQAPISAGTQAATQGAAQVVANTGAGALSNAVKPQQPASQDGADIEVVGDRLPGTGNPLDMGTIAGGVGTSAATQAYIKAAQTDQVDPQTGKKMSAADIAKYLKLAALGVSILGGALGGGKGSSAAGTVPAGFNKGLDNPAFTGNLPTVAAPQTARPMPQQDWSQYGFRPEQSFYTGVPQNYIPPLPGQMDQWSNVGKGYAKGGRARGFAVRGPGTERSDSIPAYLSDGEYVIDAPTVRAIGSGSREKGFKKLDDLRVQVRRKTPQKALKSLGAR